MVPEGEPIPNYYPRIVDDDVVYYQVQAISARQQFACLVEVGVLIPRSPMCSPHIAKCARCASGPWPASTKASPTGSRRTSNAAGLQDGIRCNKHRIRYDRFRALFLRLCERLDPQALSADGVEKALEQDRRRQEIEGELRKIKPLVDNLLDQIERTASVEDRQELGIRLTKRQARQERARAGTRGARQGKPNPYRRAGCPAHLKVLEDVISELDRLEGKEEGDDLR